MKPICVVDWHDTIEDYTNPFLDFLKTKGIDIRVEAITDSFVSMGLPSDHFIEFEKSEQFADLPQISGAYQALELLSRKYKLVCVSASKGVLTQQFKLKFRFPYIEKFLYARTKNVIINGLGASIFIDDQIPHFDGVNCRKIAFSQPWNANWRGERGDWKEILWLI